MERDKLQHEVADAFCALENKKALAVLSTGTGKALIALLIIKRLNPKKILVLVEGTTNRDVTLKAEFIKWDMSDYLPITEFVTYQLAYKWKKKEKDLSDYLIIADECDFAFTKNYGKIFKEYADVPTFAMTGYVTKEKYELYKKYLPILVNIPAQKMQKEEVLNETQLVFVQFPLSLAKTRKITYKKNGKEESFMQSENEAYHYFSKQEGKVNAKLMEAISSNDDERIKQLEKILFESIPRDRASFLHTLDSSVVLARKLAGIIIKDPNSKVITFSQRTAQADKISKYTYHGSMDSKLADENFKKFNEHKIPVLATCSKVNRGVNIDNLQFAIIESYTSSITESVQRNGRLMRLPVGEVGTIYILMPYYIIEKGNPPVKEAYPTRAVGWAREILKGLKGIKYEIYNYLDTNIIHK